jgi:hypothetical protein
MLKHDHRIEGRRRAKATALNSRKNAISANQSYQRRCSRNLQWSRTVGLFNNNGRRSRLNEGPAARILRHYPV